MFSGANLSLASLQCLLGHHRTFPLAFRSFRLALRPRRSRRRASHARGEGRRMLCLRLGRWVARCAGQRGSLGRDLLLGLEEALKRLLQVAHLDPPPLPAGAGRHLLERALAPRLHVPAVCEVGSVDEAARERKDGGRALGREVEGEAVVLLELGFEHVASCLGGDIAEVQLLREAGAEPLVDVEHGVDVCLVPREDDHHLSLEVLGGEALDHLVDDLGHVGAPVAGIELVGLVNEEDLALGLCHRVPRNLAGLPDVPRHKVGRRSLDHLVGREEAKRIEHPPHAPRDRRLARAGGPREEVVELDAVGAVLAHPHGHLDGGADDLQPRNQLVTPLQVGKDVFFPALVLAGLGTEVAAPQLGPPGRDHGKLGLREEVLNGARVAKVALGPSLLQPLDGVHRGVEANGQSRALGLAPQDPDEGRVVVVLKLKRAVKLEPPSKPGVRVLYHGLHLFAVPAQHDHAVVTRHGLDALDDGVNHGGEIRVLGAPPSAAGAWVEGVGLVNDEHAPLGCLEDLARVSLRGPQDITLEV
mmetsp:Transcript_18829/g.47494  ORF Transcript_18829/g.47494 Transcript_18829/m.47494 type:complete len:530 (-) Transcript_18829:5686-7275(-)